MELPADDQVVSSTLTVPLAPGAPTIHAARGRYVAYLMNEAGEDVIFVADRGKVDATLYHSDFDWRPIRLRPADAGGPRRIDRPSGPGWCADSGIRLSALECAWVTTCWRASEFGA